MDGVVVAYSNNCDNDPHTHTLTLELKTRVGMCQQMAAEEVAIKHTGPELGVGGGVGLGPGPFTNRESRRKAPVHGQMR